MAIVTVIRIADRPSPAVPSSVVRCGQCGHNCWLSARTGASTVALAAQYGPVEFLCGTCLDPIQAMLDGKLGIVINPAAAKEARDALRGEQN